MAKKASQTTVKTDKAAEKKPSAPNIVQPNSKVTVTVAWATVEPVYQRVLQKAAQKVKAPGFRIGKVPAQIAEGMLRQEALFEEVLEQVLPAAYQKALTESKKTPISRPEVDPIKVAKNEDWVCDVYFAEGLPIKLGKYEDSVKAALKDAEKELAEEEKAEKKDEHHDHAHHAEDTKLKHIFKHLVQDIQPQVQELLVRQEVNREVQRLVDQLKQLNLKVEDYLKSRQMTPEQLQQEYAASAVAGLQIEFILAEIAKAAKITVEEKEIDEMLEKIGGSQLSAAQKQDAEYRSYVFSNLLKQKVVQHLLAVK